jgi:hypothetical protein
MPAPPQDLAQTVVHTRTDRMEECTDAAHFLSLIATAVFIISIEYLLVTTAWNAFYGTSPPLVAALVAIVRGLFIVSTFVLVWGLYRGQDRLILLGTIFFAILFLAAAAAGFLGPAVRLFRSAKSVTISDLNPVWISFFISLAVFLASLVYIEYQIIRAGTTVSRASEAERLLLRDKESFTIGRFLLQLFGIPAITQWLEPRQRRISMALFLLSANLFAMFVLGVLNWLVLPAKALADFWQDPRGGVPAAPEVNGILVHFIPIFIVLPILFLLVLTARSVARRFTRLSLERLISRDTRPVILFLRSFHDDQVKLRKWREHLFRRLVSFGEPRPTLDHVLLEHATPHGPVVALGAPGSRPPFGIAR